MQNRSRTTPIFVSLGLAISAASAACVDVAPITDVPVADAGVDAAVSTLVETSACFQCATGANETAPSCGADYAKCAADPKCLSLFLCGMPKGCYAPGQNLVSCITTCAIAAGLTGADDPAVGPFVALYLCATTTCAEGCASTP